MSDAGGDHPEVDHKHEDDDGDADDPMGPPKEPCECWCLHCRRVFMSDQMWFQRVIGDPSGFKGFWMCPTPNCGGAGFTIDIFPTDPNHPANEGWSDDDGGEDEFNPELEYDENGDPIGVVQHPETEYDPAEAKWKELDEELAGYEDEEDLEGEEWKHGLQPGERPEDPAWMEEARRAREEEERKYDEPDQRPREIDWSDRVDRRAEGPITDDDIPF